jgi:hypothetical protein
MNISKIFETILLLFKFLFILNKLTNIIYKYFIMSHFKDRMQLNEFHTFPVHLLLFSLI